MADQLAVIQFVGGHIIISPIGGHVGGGPMPPSGPVDPGYGQGTPLPPHIWGGGWRPVDPGFGRPPPVDPGFGHPRPPVDPGYGRPVPPVHVGGGPVYPGGPVDPGWVGGVPLPPHISTGPVWPGGPVDPGYGQGHPVPPSADQPDIPQAEFILGYVPGYGITWVKNPDFDEEETPPKPQPK